MPLIRPPAQPSRKRKRAPETPSATTARQDDLCLLRLILDTWAWHPRCPLARPATSPPIQFGDAPDAPDAAAHYKATFQPFIADEAIAQLQREADEELKAGRVAKVHFRRVADLQGGKADVTCVPDAAERVPDATRKRLREGALVLLCAADPRRAPRPPTLAALCERPAATSAPTVVAAWVKYAGRTDAEGFLLEAQYGPPAGARADPEHPSATAGPALLGALDGVTPQEPRPWFLVVCSVPTTAQREMAALEAMCRRPELEALARPKATLAAHGSEYRLVWPSEARSCLRSARAAAFMPVLPRS